MTHLVIEYISESMSCDYCIGIHNIEIYFWTRRRSCSLAWTKVFTGTKEAQSTDGSTRTNKILSGESRSSFDLLLPDVCSFLRSLKISETAFLIVEWISAPLSFASVFKVYFALFGFGFRGQGLSTQPELSQTVSRLPRLLSATMELCMTGLSYFAITVEINDV